jgi:hypothetical protein
VILTTVLAANDPTGSANPIHRDDDARALGLKGGLVGGTTLYGYLALAATDLWGEPWLAHGGIAARFRSPVYDGDKLRLVLHDDTGTADRLVELVNDDGTACATATISPPASTAPIETPDADQSAVPSGLPLINYEVLRALPGLVGICFAPVVDGNVATTAQQGFGSVSRDLVGPEALVPASISIMYATFRAEGPRILTGITTRQFRTVSDGQELSARGKILKAWRYKERTYATNSVWVSTSTGLPVMHIENTTIWNL